jgi:hypothetical protein
MVKETLKSWENLSSRPLRLKVKEKNLQLEKIQGDMETKGSQRIHSRGYGDKRFTKNTFKL